MEPPNPSPVRVLIRPPSAAAAAAAATSSSSSATPTTATSSTPTIPPNPSSSLPPTLSNPSSSAPSLDGVVVVGFVGSRAEDDEIAHLINRVLDANVFGSGGRDWDIRASRSSITGEQMEKDWFRHRRISYYHDQEKGIVFLQFSSSLPWWLSCAGESEGADDRPYLVVEERESNDLRGMLLMFSVCHLIIFLHEGFSFDPHMLKKFRMLQGARNALAPVIRSHAAPAVASKATSYLSKPTVPTKSSTAGSSRHGSTISLMSGSGSHLSLLPGQCIPIILFVFYDELFDGPSTASNVEDSTDISSLNQSSNLSGMLRPGMNPKGSSSVVMLARPINKAEGSFRKKLQLSLETQIRFLLKRCRTLSGTESSHTGSRGAGNASSLPLFSLDASKVVVLLDRSINHKGESLDFVTSLVEDILISKVASEILMLENNSQSSNNEDIQSIKDFIYRQSDALRGRGALPTNASSVGVGMVAAAAAAAAASAAAGKPLSAPELPSLENWLSSSNFILDLLFSVEHGSVGENGNMKQPSIPTIVKDEKTSLVGNSAAEASISWLESSKGLNLKFSMSWCERALPTAKEVYLKDLPACYPTAVHKVQLEKALHAFHLMVKGPAVQMFVKRLEDECTSIWESGRQLCDAVSLTGKPCIHQRNHAKDNGSPLEVDIVKHSSGFVFLHACACGRSRRLRDDPFDFESANVTFNCFPNCENLIPKLVLPEGSKSGPLHACSWSLIRLAGARYYDPSKGLLQSGFCSAESFLLRWTISFEKEKETCEAITHDKPMANSTPDPKLVVAVAEETKKADVQIGALGNQMKASQNISSDNSSISFGKGLPSFVMKKAFSEVVAGRASTDQKFSLLQQRKQTKSAVEKGAQQKSSSDQMNNEAHLANGCKGSKAAASVPVQEEPHTGSQINVDPFLQIGSNVVPVNMSPGGKIKSKTSLKQVVIYVGFEYECPHGHRFLLSAKHLKKLGSLYSLPEQSHFSSTEDPSENYAERLADLNIYKDGLHKKIYQHSGGKDTAAVTNTRKTNRASVTTTACDQQYLEKECYRHGCMENFEEKLPRVRLDDGRDAYSLLNSNLPIYMNCPHCINSKKDRQKIKFASTVSQLQRIFMVTPSFPVVLATCPVVQFEESCIPPSVLDRELQSQFSLSCRVTLPPESFLTIKLPFVYGVQLDDRSLQPLNHDEHQPELTAWLAKGTVLQLISKECNVSDDSNME